MFVIFEKLDKRQTNVRQMSDKCQTNDRQTTDKWQTNDRKQQRQKTNRQIKKK